MRKDASKREYYFAQRIRHKFGLMGNTDSNDSLNITSSQCFQRKFAGGQYDALMAKFHDDNVIGIIDQPVEEATKLLFPNPTNSSFALILNKVETNCIAELYNSIGQLVLRKHIHPFEKEIDISNLETGVYFIKILNGHAFYSRKVIKLD